MNANANADGRDAYLPVRLFGLACVIFGPSDWPNSAFVNVHRDNFQVAYMTLSCSVPTARLDSDANVDQLVRSRSAHACTLHGFKISDLEFVGSPLAYHLVMEKFDISSITLYVDIMRLLLLIYAE